MKKALLYLSLLLSTYSYAFIAGQVEVYGTVVDLNKNFVTLQKGKAKIEVPRGTVKIKPKTKLTTGIKVKALLTAKELNDTILRIRNKKNQRRIASQRYRKENRKPASSEYDH